MQKPTPAASGKEIRPSAPPFKNAHCGPAVDHNVDARLACFTATTYYSMTLTLLAYPVRDANPTGLSLCCVLMSTRLFQSHVELLAYFLRSSRQGEVLRRSEGSTRALTSPSCARNLAARLWPSSPAAAHRDHPKPPRSTTSHDDAAGEWHTPVEQLTPRLELSMAMRSLRSSDLGFADDA